MILHSEHYYFIHSTEHKYFIVPIMLEHDCFTQSKRNFLTLNTEHDYIFLTLNTEHVFNDLTHAEY